MTSYIDIDYKTWIDTPSGKKELIHTKYPILYTTDKNDWQMTENINRIKLPCYCTFEWRGKRRLGMIQNAGLRENGYEQVTSWFLCRLIELDKQTHQQVGDTISIDYLDDLIKRNKINIGKAKIIYTEK